MRVVTLTIPGAPIGKGRPRFSRKSGTAYTPLATRTTEAAIKRMAKQEMASAEPIEGPILVELMAQIEPPLSWSKNKRTSALLGEIRPTGRPDLDNVFKLVCDAANQIVFRDDAQIVEARMRKQYGPRAVTVFTVRAA